MKQMGKVKKGLVLGLVACCLSLFTSVQAETPILGTATVRAIHGTAKYKSPDGTWLPLKVGKNLTQGDTISTSTDTTLDLFLRQNGPVLRVMADTTLGLNILNFTDSTGERVVNTQLGLTAGRILGNVKKLSASSTYEIKTPNGVAAIRGTDYDVSVELHDQQYTVHFTCISGTLIARSTVGTSFTVVLNTGETWTPGEREKQVVPVATLEELINLLSFWDGGEGKDLVRNVPVPTIDVITRIDPQTGSPNTSTLNIIP